MPAKIPSMIAGLSTFFILILVAILFVFGQIVLLNGASESDAFNALTVSVICQSVALFPAIILARWLTKLLITRFDWKKFPAVVAAIIAGTGLGAVLSFLSIIVGTFTAGIR